MYRFNHFVLFIIILIQTVPFCVFADELAENVNQKIAQAQVILTVSESKRLIAKAVAQMPIVKQALDGITDVTPQPFNARTRVHEYGGGSFTVKEGVVYFSNFSDQHIYYQKPGKDPVLLTKENNMRYADGIIDGKGNILCVREDHTGAGEAVNTLVSINNNGESHILVCGNNFYSSPRLSPDGSLLAWLHSLRGYR